MASLRAPRRSAAGLAADRVIDRFVEAANAGRELPFPNGANVVPSDLATEERIREAHESGYTVAIVDEHERVTVLPAPDPSLGERNSERFWRELGIDW